MYMYVQDNLQKTMRRSTLFRLAFMSTEKPVYDDYVVQRFADQKECFLLIPCVLYFVFVMYSQSEH